jgi:serine/threonine protein kinase
MATVDLVSINNDQTNLAALKTPKHPDDQVDKLLSQQHEAEMLSEVLAKNPGTELFPKILGVTTENGKTKILFELLKGKNLADYLEAQGKPLDAKKVLGLFRNLLNAVKQIHDSGIVHRDIKPGNIWMGEDGTVKVFDFGLALRKNEITRKVSQKTVGTPLFLSPEISNRKFSWFNPAQTYREGDLWSVGVTMYWALTGQLPFETLPFFITKELSEYARKNKPIVLPETIPVGFRPILSKMLAPRNTDRYHSVDEIIADLNKITPME